MMTRTSKRPRKQFQDFQAHIALKMTKFTVNGTKLVSEMMNKVVHLVLNLSNCHDLDDKCNEKLPYPKDLDVLVNKTLLFKVEFKNIFSSRLDQSFRVNKICNDAAILQKFKQTNPKSLDGSTGSGP